MANMEGRREMSLLDYGGDGYVPTLHVLDLAELESDSCITNFVAWCCGVLRAPLGIC